MCIWQFGQQMQHVDSQVVNASSVLVSVDGFPKISTSLIKRSPCIMLPMCTRWKGYALRNCRIESQHRQSGTIDECKHRKCCRWIKPCVHCIPDRLDLELILHVIDHKAQARSLRILPMQVQVGWQMTEPTILLKLETACGGMEVGGRIPRQKANGHRPVEREGSLTALTN